MRISLGEVGCGNRWISKLLKEYKCIPPQVSEIDKKRKAMVERAVQELREKGLVSDFLTMVNENEADFLITYVDGIYGVCWLDVTDRAGVKSKKIKHPRNEIISIDLEENLESVESKILHAIESKKRNWTS